MRVRRYLLAAACSLASLAAVAQEESSVFSFLRLPTSTHAAAIGGQGIALADNDAALMDANPALMQNVRSKTMSLGFMSYMQGVKTGSAHYVQAVNPYGTWGVTAQFASYGSIVARDEGGVEMGSFSPTDFSVGGGYSHVLSDWISAGATGRFIYSHYDGYTSLALGIDLGLNYFDEDLDLSVSATASNIGVQVKRFNEVRERLPFNLQLGVVKGLGHAPVRIAVTLVDLTRWNKNFYYAPDKDISTGALIFNHLVVGADIMPAKFLYISLGYNFRRAYELKAAGSSKLSGLTLGAGVNVKNFSVGLSWAKYHVSASSLGINVQYSL